MTARTNREAFEAYRDFDSASWRTDFETAIERHTVDPFGLALAVAGFWVRRYNWRRLAIDDPDAPLFDRLGREFVLRGNRDRDVIEGGAPDFMLPTLQARIEDLLRGATDGVMPTLGEPHYYGPSLTRLWREAIRQGRRTERERWLHVGEWACRPPAEPPPEPPSRALAARLRESVVWRASEILGSPWSLMAESVPWRIRLGDFPEEPTYVLMVGMTRVGAFHDWPEAWSRPEEPD
jgi:hypothetical protein